MNALELKKTKGVFMMRGKIRVKYYISTFFYEKPCHFVVFLSTWKEIRRKTIAAFFEKTFGQKQIKVSWNRLLGNK